MTAVKPALVLLLAVTGCLEVADGRARRDQTIGQASAAGVTVAVDEGLAHVRELEPGRLRLWAQAPALSLTITRDASAAASPWPSPSTTS